ncbi:MAG: MmgE/PrpD family protein [Proteobacteria bacterium]|nr:MmgE/PrpD family protein [Pseudomonadota bacterium]
MSPTQTAITAGAARFVEGLRFEDLPEEAVRTGKRCLVDGLGLFIAGTDEETLHLLIAEAKHQGGRAEALLLGAGEAKVPMAMAARVLGTAGHAHDWDDTQVSRDPGHQYGLLTHPTVPPLAAALAVAQGVGRVSGRAFMTAFQAGFEVECKISEWIKPRIYKTGFHSSGVVGTFGACAAAAKLLGLEGRTLCHALGIAASLAAGIRVNFGTMTKPLHVGRAAENGVTAALLARRGFTADADALDGPWGFCQVFAGGVSEEKLGQGFGRTFSIVDPGVSIKPYPSGILTHQAMDAMLKLVTEHDLEPEAVKAVRFHAGSNILNPIRYALAADHLQAKFSMAALLAMILIRRRAGRREFTNAFIQDPLTQAVQRRITTHLDPAIEAKGTDVIRSRLEVETNDGRRLVQWADERYRGGPLNPLSESDLEAKFRAATDGLIDRERERAILAAVRGVAELADAAELARLIQP